MRIGTKVIHGGLKPDPATGAIMTPIYQTSTYIQDGPGGHKGYEYSRMGNPTRTALEANIASVENGKYGIAFASGLAAIDALLKTLKPGDEVISTSDLYGGSYRLFTKIFEKYGIKFHFTPMETTLGTEELINENTKLIWVESPTNPMLNIIDIKAMAELARAHDILLGVDNTFATPCLQIPLDLGADLVMHSATKYIGGHSDLMMGLLVVNDEKLANDLYFIQNSSGAICGPQDAFLALRGMKTLQLRMQRHSENAAAIATYLKQHPKVDQVLWPGLEDHPGHTIATKQMKAYGGMLSFRLKSDLLEDAVNVLKRTKIFACAESLGGVESLIGHPATMTHAAIPKEEREKSGITDTLIRLSVGIEDVHDLIHDLSIALN